MRACSRRYGIALSLATALLMVFGGISSAAVATVPKKKPTVKSHVLGPLSGTWSGTYSGAYSGKFTLRWKELGSRLHGSITLSQPSGTYGINGSVDGSALGFGVVGAGATYTGSVSHNSMSGHYKSPQGRGSWSARKVS